MNGSAYFDEGLSLHKLDLDSAAEDMAEVVDEEPESSLMDEDYAEEEDEDEFEEAWSEEDERPTQYDFRQYGVYQSLPLSAGPPDLQSDCTTAEEYIKRVRYSFCAGLHSMSFTCSKATQYSKAVLQPLCACQQTAPAGYFSAYASLTLSHACSFVCLVCACIQFSHAKRPVGCIQVRSRATTPDCHLTH